MNALEIATKALNVNEIMAAGFHVTRFSTDDCMILVSTDSTAKVIVEQGKATVYSTKDNLKKYNIVSALVDIL